MRNFNLKSQAIAICLLFCLSTSAYDFTADGICYDITSFTELTAKASSIEADKTGDIIIPGSVEYLGKNLSVTEIGDNMLYQNQSVTSVTIEAGIKKIGNNAFAECSKLTKVILPKGVVSIGNSAFEGCSELTKIDLPEVVSIGNSAFEGCSKLTKIDLPESLEEIGTYTFADCTSLESVSISSMPTMPNGLFHNCTKLSDVTIPPTVTTIGSNVFENCTSLVEIVFPNTITSLGEKILRNCTSLEKVTIGNGISTLPYIFEGCQNLKELIIVDSEKPLALDIAETRKLNYINYDYNRYYYASPGTFANLNITDVYIGRNISYSKSLINFDFTGGSYYYYVPEPPFARTPIKNIVYGNLVTDLQSSNTHNETGILESCTQLESVKILGDITEFPDRAFFGCTNLEELKIPNSVEIYGKEAFANCTSLKTISIGSHCTSIGEEAFTNCDNINEINCYSTIPPKYEGNFSANVYTKGSLNIPTNCLEQYKSTSPWNNFWNINEVDSLISDFIVDEIKYEIVAEDNIKAVGYTFNNNKDVIIPSDLTYLEHAYNVQSIGDEAFKDCQYITSICLGNNITSIGASAFKGCTGLTSVKFGDRLTTIGESAFENCSSIELLYIPASVTSFGENAFNSCSSLKELTFENGDSPLVFPHGSYDGQTNIMKKTVNGKTIQYRIKYYNGYFNKLPIEKLYIGRNLSDEKRYTISGNGGVDEYVITQYDGPLGNLPKLTELTIGENVSTLGPQEAHILEVDMTSRPGSFYYCDAITRVKVNAVTPPTGADFSSTAYANATLVVPDNSIEDYKAATGWKEFYNIISESEATGISNVETNTEQNVKIENGNIVVENVRGIVNIYDIAGTLVKRVKADGNRIDITLPQRGIYIVKTGRTAVKVVI